MNSYPAILGGDPAIQEPLPRWPYSTDAERANLSSVLESDQWWSKGGTQVSRLEQRFSAFHQCSEGIACANGTHALELALRVLKIGPGDEVLVPAMTFASTSMAVMTVGARPIPVDIEDGTWCMDAVALRYAITPSTRAIMPVHFAGQICDMERIADLAAEHSLRVIEDAAHAHGAKRMGRAAGSFGDVAAFSFQNYKLMTAGEGGMLITNDADIAQQLRLISNCGRPDGDRVYRHEILGTNSRMTEFQAAILNGQMDRLDELADLRARRVSVLRQLLEHQSYIRLQKLDPRTDRHATYMIVMDCDPDAFGGMTRDNVVRALVAEGLPAYRVYPPVQHLAHFSADFLQVGGDEGSIPQCPISTRLAKTGIWLHHKLLLGQEELLVQAAEAIGKVSKFGSELARHFACAEQMR
jgi:3-amino-5-hydroxybenzoate synthase